MGVYLFFPPSSPCYSGTMSGGGNKVAKGRMCSSFVSDIKPEQLAAMEKSLEKETKASEVQQTNFYPLSYLIPTNDHIWHL